MSVKKQAIKLIHRQLAQLTSSRISGVCTRKTEEGWEEREREEETINAKYKRSKSFGFFAQQNERHGKDKQTNRERERLPTVARKAQYVVPSLPLPSLHMYVFLHLPNVSWSKCFRIVLLINCLRYQFPLLWEKEKARNTEEFNLARNISSGG